MNQLYVTPVEGIEVAVKVTLLPIHMFEDDAEADTSLTPEVVLIVLEPILLHPFASMTVTIYSPAPILVIVCVF